MSPLARALPVPSVDCLASEVAEALSQGLEGLSQRRLAEQCAHRALEALAGIGQVQRALDETEETVNVDPLCVYSFRLSWAMSMTLEEISRFDTRGGADKYAMILSTLSECEARCEKLERQRAVVHVVRAAPEPSNCLGRKRGVVNDFVNDVFAEELNATMGCIEQLLWPVVVMRELICPALRTPEVSGTMEFKKL